MTVHVLDSPRSVDLPIRTIAAWLVAIVLFLSPMFSQFLPSPWVEYPKAMIVPISDWVGRNLVWLAREASIGSVKIADVTRVMAAIAETPMRGLNVLITSGLNAGSGENVHRAVPPLSWFTLYGLIVFAGFLMGRRRLAAICGAGLGYLVIFGLWTDAMATLASVFISTIVAVLLGLALGTFVERNQRLLGAVEAVMNVMQTVPVFSYLVPTLLFLGYGPSAALVATAIYAMPPMVHATTLGLRSVPVETIEYGEMAGATPRQIYWQIMLPSAVRYLGTGINQTIMASLNMVIIASMIGAGGLGYLVLLALRRLDIGAALEAGMAIVVLAVILDRLSQAAANNLANAHRMVVSRRSAWQLALGWLIASTSLALLVPILQDWPNAATISTAPYWNAMVSWINIHCFDVLDGIRSFALIEIMNPLKAYLLSMPWVAIVTLVGLAGYMVNGFRLAFSSSILLTAIVLTGFWDPAVVSIYLVALGAVISLLIGFPIGYAAARVPRLREPISLFLDTLQTLPTLVYIIPAVMLFRNGDFSAVLAIVSYAVAPAIRYSLLAFSEVPVNRMEAAIMSGATAFQAFKWVRLPHAFPTLILGLNQTVMMAIAMLVITALVGTRDLGQQVFIALSRMKVGDGIVGGLAVAALALTADGLLKAWAKRATAASSDISSGH
jgi:glycine betaine/proline transport system permease protein